MRGVHQSIAKLANAAQQGVAPDRRRWLERGLFSSFRAACYDSSVL